MAQAFRKRFSDTGIDIAQEQALKVQGTYNLDLKVTVEWERSVTIGEVAKVLEPVLSQACELKTIRHHLAGHFRSTDEFLPPGKISKYRISRQSAQMVVDALCEAGWLLSTDDSRWHRS